MSAERRIDFIIIGAQKAGTTALFDFLAEDPAFSLSDVKETHFFDDEAADWAQPDYAPYHARFDWSRPAIRGEATPIYCYWPQSLERIARYNPAIRLILLLRDPVARAWSHWRMEYARGVETLPFSQAIREGRRRLFEAGGRREGQPWGYDREFSYVERGYYGEQVERILELFPREQLLVLQAEDLRRDPNPILAEVAGFLGAPPPPARAPREVHVGREMDYGGELAEADAAFLRQIYARDQARLAQLLTPQPGRPAATKRAGLAENKAR
jgi:hypothetical protein